VVVALVAGILIAGFSITNTSDEGLTHCEHTVMQRQPVGSPVRTPRSSVRRIQEFTRLFTAPKVATWIIRPQLPC
jgi:hypothetical protein